MKFYMTRSDRPETNALTRGLSAMSDYYARLSTDDAICLVDVDTKVTMGWYPKNLFHEVIPFRRPSAA
jgi:hypothetical protein